MTHSEQLPNYNGRKIFIALTLIVICIWGYWRYQYSLLYYRFYLLSLKSRGMVIVTAEEYFSHSSNGTVVILRHDVDLNPERALDMAKLEYELDITSSYYFRLNLLQDPRYRYIFDWLTDHGFEIGFHYENNTLHDALRSFKFHTLSVHGGNVRTETLPSGVEDISGDLFYSDQYSSTPPISFDGNPNIILIHPERWHVL